MDEGERTTEGVGAAWRRVLVARERARGYASLVGSRAEVAILVRQALVDRLLARAFSSRPETRVAVDLLEGARVGVTVFHRVLGLPVGGRTVFQLDSEVDLVGWRLVLRHDNGALWKMIRTVAGTLGFLPAGVTFGAGTAEVDLRALAARGGFADLLPLVRRLVIHGPADGLFAIDVDLVVPGFAEGQRSSDASQLLPADSPVGPGPEPSATDAGEWFAALAGSHARVDLCVHESLANEALSLARTLAATSPAPTPAEFPWHWTSFVREARVRFAERQLALWLDVEVPGVAPAAKEASAAR